MVHSSIEKRFWKYVIPEPNSGCWLWTGGFFDKDGYGIFCINQKWKERAHRLSFRIHNGLIPEGLFVLHHCDVPCCVNPDHLFLGTQADNMEDKVSKGRQNKGVDQPRARLTEAQVKEVRSTKESVQRLANKLGVSRMTVWRARVGATWKHLESRVIEDAT